MCHVERSETSDIYLIINNLFGFFAALRMTHNYVHLLNTFTDKKHNYNIDIM